MASDQEMAVMRGGAVVVLGLMLGAVTICDAKAEAGKACTAKSCDTDGNCEERTCLMMDSVGELSPAAKGRIQSCQG